MRDVVNLRAVMVVTWRACLLKRSDLGKIEDMPPT